ncbi:probable mediator of RNA polymerase II transcription subunit 26b isoform X2 [Syzygium oleosum]|uniref:probable mediator of RNA polymerase II transcription subunit 26b isoform X2 n=1 Tax=Syzygium oleosum TaxID=219896 RepID=UPI0024BA635F|nr:probable mediator of RNA polymerase II transcription subunit 26b isoform X2 [Syzygium oleosum]
MGESLDDWRDFFGTVDIFEFIETAITIAVLDRPRDFRLQRDRIAERLFSTTSTQSRQCPGCDDLPESRDGGDDCVRANKESKTIRDNSKDDVERDGVDMNPESYLDYGGAEAFSDEIDEQSQIVGEVLRIKRVLDNSQHESDSALYESLRKLQLMTISMDVLEKTKIGITVNSLRRKGGSTQIAQLAHNITMRWKAMVEEICRSTKDVADSYVDLRKVGKIDCASGLSSSVKNQNAPKWQQEKHANKASSIAKRNQRPNMNQQQATVKPNTSSSINSKTIPPGKIATQKFEKERMLQNSNGIMGSKRLFTGRRDINSSDEVAVEKKFGASKRILQEHYQQAESAKRQRTVLALPALPKQPASHKGPGPRAQIEITLSQMAKSRRRISLF